MTDAARATLAPTAVDPALPIELRPGAWRDARWLGEISGYTTSPDLFAGAWLPPEARRTVSRLYAAACADLAQATLGGLSTHSQEWERWFAALRTTARQLSPAQAGDPRCSSRAASWPAPRRGRGTLGTPATARVRRPSGCQLARTGAGSDR
jgi:hypothetical protein